MTSIMGDVTGSGCSERDSARTGAEMGAGTGGDAYGPKTVEGKVDIIISDKTNKTPILVYY